MKYLWNLAVKNLSRNKLRSSISIAAIAISVCMVVMIRGFMLGILDSMVTLHIQYNSGHIKIVDQDYQKKERLLSLNHPVDGFSGEGVQKMADKLKEIPGIERVIQRLKFGAAASYEDKLIGMMGWGVKPADELAFTDIENQLVEGRMVKEGYKEVVLGTDLLKKLNLKVGDKITLFYTTAFGSFKGTTFEIVGRIESGLKLLDEIVFYIPLDQAQRILNMPDQVTELLLVTQDYRKVDSILPQVKELFAAEDPEGRYLVIPWDKSNDIIAGLKIAEKIYNIIYVLLIVLASFVVINTMIMIVKERTQEIGMMSALGLMKRDILFMFIMEGTVMGILGSLIGVIFGGVGVKILSIVGIDYTEALSGMEAEVLLKPILYPVFTIENLIFSFVLGVTVTAVTCIIPARKAAQLEPNEALRAL
ncbi:ABC transporter permease [Anoxybacter fermentans]|uniref:ABC transporter permease n=1 Tax=Anoxybacter fermentans TaxID=1323375 RepID=A0A3Q9HNV6_9FIRM|nr:FtsX-like permease family protein [Anoxybacter fermentans]AZR72177.1 ABC transporter permease [Anoxybacter fermentans]